MSEKKVVCLGGGIGTVNLLKGLKDITPNITVVVSMADEGGSSGRLRRLYDIQPPGDLISCVAALSTQSEEYKKLLTYRFPGDRYGADSELSGHKLGNLIMAAAISTTGSFFEAIELLKKMFSVSATILPATDESVTISAETVEGITVTGEENIDLGKYEGKRVLEKVQLHPEHPKISEKILQSLEEADAIIAGPGDLYTTLLPVLIIPEIADFLKKSTKKKIFIVNVANKPFETKGYDVADFIQAITKHLGTFPFDSVVVNNNFAFPIPSEFKYSYVENTDQTIHAHTNIVATDLIDEKFPLYHDFRKLALVIEKNI